MSFHVASSQAEVVYFQFKDGQILWYYDTVFSGHLREEGFLDHLLTHRGDLKRRISKGDSPATAIRLNEDRDLFDRYVMKFIETGKIPKLDWETYQSLLELADRLNISSLEKFLKEQVSLEVTAFQRYEELKEIRDRFYAIFESLGEPKPFYLAKQNLTLTQKLEYYATRIFSLGIRLDRLDLVEAACESGMFQMNKKGNYPPYFVPVYPIMSAFDMKRPQIILYLAEKGALLEDQMITEIGFYYTHKDIDFVKKLDSILDKREEKKDPTSPISATPHTLYNLTTSSAAQ